MADSVHLEHHPSMKSAKVTPHPKPRRNLHRHFLKQWREHRGYSQEAAAERLGMDRSNLSKIENSKVPYSQELLEHAAEVYMCSVPDLLIRDPSQSEAIWSLWESAKEGERQQIIDLAKVILKRSA
jgi:transcriptional regulator with XRE-family HTH domain